MDYGGAVKLDGAFGDDTFSVSPRLFEHDGTRDGVNPIRFASWRCSIRCGTFTLSGRLRDTGQRSRARTTETNTLHGWVGKPLDRSTHGGRFKGSCPGWPCGIRHSLRVYAPT
jgi:hypothetical protein